jgi:hypothetical protein
MTHPLVAALEDAFQEVRDRDLTLGERLKYVADCVRTKGPDFATAVDIFVSRLEAAQAGSTAPMVGRNKSVGQIRMVKGSDGWVATR